MDQISGLFVGLDEHSILFGTISAKTVQHLVVSGILDKDLMSRVKKRSLIPQYPDKAE